MKILHIFVAILLASALCAQTYTPVRGVFSVSATKKIQFATENAKRTATSDLFKFSEITSLEHDDWQVLNSDEWTYLLVSRGIYLNALGVVKGKKGLIILPDNFVLPEGLSFVGNSMHLDDNQYDAEQWAKMEAAGAVFLPAGGHGFYDEYDVFNWEKSIVASPLAGAEVFAFTGGEVSGTEGNEVLQLLLSAVTNDRLEAGVPYLLRWPNDATLFSTLYFYDVENWVTETTPDVIDGDIVYHGFYPKTHITGDNSPAAAHYNFFLGAEDKIYWPTDGGNDDAKMKGFRAYFSIKNTPGAAIKRGMNAVFRIVPALGSPTGIENSQEPTANSQKLIKDGRVLLIIDGEAYSIGGQRL